MRKLILNPIKGSLVVMFLIYSASFEQHVLMQVQGISSQLIHDHVEFLIGGMLGKFSYYLKVN